MNDIERLYKKAGITPRRNWWCRRFDETSIADCNGTRNGEKECSKCEYGYISSEKYPLFTAEKQIELIKFITSLGVCEIENWNDKGFHFAIKRERIYPTMFLSLSNINLQETLSDVINNLWQDLTEEEKQQIKEIIE